MQRLLLIFLSCCVSAPAALPDELSIATNYEVNHRNKHTNSGKRPEEGSISTNYEASHQNEHHRVVTRNAVIHDQHTLFREKRQAVTCDSKARFRSADGTCNNLQNPTWGSADQVFRRLLTPVYDDTLTTPRLQKKKGGPLPSPREVSTRVHDFDRRRLSRRATVMLMDWGQFLAHDITGTPVDTVHMTSAKCCSNFLVTGGALHPDVNSGGACFPIIVPPNDRHFKNIEHRCMEFVRSFPVYVKDVRQQMNELSSFIDGTNVYGRNETEMDALRDTSGGKLRVKNTNNLPESSENYCIKESAGDYCLKAGDSRVNVYPGLGALHTIFLRYHNYVAGELADRHKSWDNDQLFYTARKIVIAVLQHITYNEYLPAIIGPDAMSTHGLNSNFAYDDSCDASLYNVFATAAFRFGHSMVPDGLVVDGKYVTASQLFKRPFYVLQHLDSLVEGLVGNRSENVDRWYSTEMTDHLFEESPFQGYDIAALNIQRGRDHGLRPYNDWRMECGQKRITFADLPRHARRRFQNVYRDANDIDLYSGALTETPVAGGIVGKTYACLLAKQFAKLRNCDRFWFETKDPVAGFDSEAQRDQIHRTLLSHVILLTTNIDTIQERVFSVPGSRRRSIQRSRATILADQMDFDFF